MNKKHVLFLFGGCSSEHDVSLQSARAVLSHLDGNRFRAVPVGITKAGQWLLLTEKQLSLPSDTWNGIPCTLDLSRDSRGLLLLDGTGSRLPVDAVFPILHGRNGEDGTIQGVCELAELPIIGCGCLSSALCMDKERAHRLAASAGVRVPKSAAFSVTDDRAVMMEAAETLGWPLFVKPLRAGSSFGVSRVPCARKLPEALDKAFSYDSEIVLEEAVPGFEVGCAVMGNDTLTIGAIDEVELKTGFFDYEEKYTLKTASIHCPARIPPEKADELRQTAAAVYRALGCRVMARVDLFLTPDGEIVFNEVNTIPGFTSHSRFPTMMREIGIPFGELITRLIELGVQA